MLLAIILAASSPQASACAKLADDYETASKRLALSFAESIGEKSAVRETMREAHAANVRAEASQTLELMKAHGCALPLSAPNPSGYLSPAMDCQIARMERVLDPVATPITACDMSTWVKSSGK